MEIEKGFEIIDLCLYIKKYKILVIADIHLGYEESLNQRGVLIPRMQFKDTYERIEKILNNNDIETVVVTGDLKHEFGIINRTEWDNILKIIDLFLKYSKKLVIIKGNHDVALPFIAKKKGIELSEYYKIDDIFVCHGDEIIDNDDFRKCNIVIIGHEHPAIGFRDKSKYENFKCFLKGKYLDKMLIVLPSFNTLTIGTDVLRNKLLSPFLHQDLKNFKAYVMENNKIYDFGKLNKFK
ncbi:metallophosphoesterase [Candidatus Woesearchaeota archaeon]|nr:metallophosphoesterase [Candidatus Woesearchaeota archaeon]